MDRSEPEASVGKMSTFVAASGRFGRSRFALWIDCMVSTFGRRTCIPLEFFSYVFERDIAMDILVSEEMTSGTSVYCGVDCGG